MTLAQYYNTCFISTTWQASVNSKAKENRTSRFGRVRFFFRYFWSKKAYIAW